MSSDVSEAQIVGALAVRMRYGPGTLCRIVLQLNRLNIEAENLWLDRIDSRESFALIVVNCPTRTLKRVRDLVDKLVDVLAVGCVQLTNSNGDPVTNDELLRAFG